MSLVGAVLRFLLGYIVAGAAVIIVARVQDETWKSGFLMLSLSLPVTILYFVCLWWVGRWRYLAPTSLGMGLAGVWCAIFPAFCGFFPVYFVRLKFAIPLTIIQFGLLLVSSAISARICKIRAAT